MLRKNTGGWNLEVDLHDDPTMLREGVVMYRARKLVALCVALSSLHAEFSTRYSVSIDRYMEHDFTHHHSVHFRK